MFNTYSTTLLLLAAFTTAFGVAQHVISSKGSSLIFNSPLRSFKLKYLVVFGVSMMADWFQGSYLYSLYHEEFGYSVHTIAILFVIGFISAGLSAPYIGLFADRYGRKKLCLYFTLFYFLSCATKMFRPVVGLAFGRLLGGIATSILFSVFESWLITASKAEGMDSVELGDLLGRCTLINGLAAAFSGVSSDALVAQFGSFKAPFVASALLLVLAGVLIQKFWTENYGGDATNATSITESTSETIQNSLRVVRENPSLSVLLLAMTVYETALYLFVFLWVPTLQAKTDESLPLGTIFSCFMISFSLGSMIYNFLLARASKYDGLATPLIGSRKRNDGYAPQPFSVASDTTIFDDSEELRKIDQEISELEGNLPMSDAPMLVSDSFPEQTSPSILFHARLLAAIMLVASTALAASIGAGSAQSRVYAFLIFELTVGLYYPTMGTLRSLLIPDALRATLSSLFRVPLNVLVTLALISGMESRPVTTFSLLSLSLTAGSVAVISVICKN